MRCQRKTHVPCDLIKKVTMFRVIEAVTAILYCYLTDLQQFDEKDCFQSCLNYASVDEVNMLCNRTNADAHVCLQYIA